MIRVLLSAAVAGFVLGASALTTPAAALSAKECCANYQAAKQAGTLNGQTWNDFRKTGYGGVAAPAPAPAPAPATTAIKTAPAPAP